MSRTPYDLTVGLNDSMDQLTRDMQRRNNPAGWMFKRLVKQIKAFEARLDHEEEIGGYLATGAGPDAFHIVTVGYSDPDLLIFEGLNQDGRPVQLVQHHSQLSLLLTALPKLKEEPRRIGFLLDQVRST